MRPSKADFLTLTQMATELGINRQTLKTCVRDGRLKGEEIDGKYYFRRADLARVGKEFEQVKKRIRNVPPISAIVRQFLKSKGVAVSFEEIFQHVIRLVQIRSETPRKSVYSVIYRMQDVQRVDSPEGTKFKLIR